MSHASGQSSGTTTRLVLEYVRRQAGPDAVREVVAFSGVPHSEARLADERAWFPMADAVALLEAAAVVLGDSDAPYNIGRAVLKHQVGTTVRLLLQSLGSPALVARGLPRAVAKFSTAVRVDLVDVDRHHAVFDYFLLPGVEPHRAICRHTLGLLTQLGPMFGLEESSAEHLTCVHEGDDRCRYKVTWSGWSVLPWRRRRVEGDDQVRLEAVTRQLEQLQLSLADLVTVPDVDEVLVHVLQRVGAAVGSEQQLLAVRGDEGEIPAVVHEGFPDEAAAWSLAQALLAGDTLPHGSSILMAEVASARRSYGVLACVHPAGHSFFPAERRLLEGYARQAALALDAAMAVAEARRGGDTSRALLALAHELAGVAAPREVAQRIADVVPGLLGVDASAVVLIDADRGVLQVEAAQGWPEAMVESVVGFEVPFDSSPLIAHVMAEPRPLYVTPEIDDPFIRAVLEEFETDAAMVVPIVARDAVIGLVAGIRRGPAPALMPPDVLEILQGLADQAATALENGRLLAELRRQLAAAEETEQKLREARSTLAHLIEAGPILTFRGTTDGFRITYVSGNVQRLFGFEPDEFLARAWLDLVHPDEQEYVWINVQRLLVTDEVEIEARVRDAAGEYRNVWIHLRGEPVGPDGHREILGYVRDQTAQRTVEERYRVVSELTSDFAYAFNVRRDGSLTPDWASGAHEAITGYTLAEGTQWGSWAEIIHPDDRPAFVQSINELIAGHDQENEFRILHKSGDIRWVSLLARPVFDATGRVVKLYGAATDITERRWAEEALREREAELIEAHRLAGLGSWRLDLATGKLDISAELTRVIGLENVTERTIELARLHIHPDDQEHAVGLFGTEPAGREPRELEYRFIRPDGEVRWLHTVSRPEFDERGEVVGYRGVTQDITDRHRAEELHRAISEAVSDAAFSYSVSQGRMVLEWVTDAWERLTGYKVTEPASTELFRPIIHPDDVALMEESEQAVLAGQTNVAEFRVFDVGRSIRWLRIYAVPVRDTSGEVTRVYGAAQDVTERRLAEEALRASEERFRRLVEESPLAIVAYDPDGFVIMWNPAAEKLFGWSADEVVGRYPPTVSQELREELIGLSHRVAAGEEVTSAPSRRMRRDGTMVDVEVSAARAAFPGFDRPSIIVMLADVTERRRLEAELVQAQKLKALGQLAGGVAHDFNNLLTAILGHAEFLLDDPGDEADVRENAEAIFSAGEQAASLTRQLLLVSRHEPPDAVVLDLNAVVRSAEPTLRRLVGEGVELVVAAAEEQAPVRAARAQLEQVLLNLVVNARDAMPGGGTVRITTGPTETNGEGASVMLTVEDTGCGMDRETVQRAFEPFFTTKAAGRGTGLGLAVVFGIVNGTGGQVSIDSEPGRGTRVSVRVPVEVGAVPAPPEEPVPGLTSATGVETVLLVEDDPDVRRMAHRALERAGYFVLEAADGEEALHVAGRHRSELDLLVTDVLMPAVGGAELAERLRSHLPDLKVLFISGFTEARIGDSPDYLQKPFTPAQLLYAVRRVLDETPAAAAEG